MLRILTWGILMLAAAGVQAGIKVVTSSTDLGAIVQEIGGEDVEVTSLGQGRSNLHFIEVLPSHMLKVSRADIYCKVGLMLDQWASSVIDGARNDRLVVVDCSKGIDILDKPAGRVDASMGDVHPEGNPHYWLDPRNGKVIAQNVLDGLCRTDPSHAATYTANFTAFCARLDSAWQVWTRRAAEFKGTKLVSYHSTYAYFAKAFELEVIGYIEPKPGIEPTPSHTSALIDLMRQQKVNVIFREPYYSDRTPAAIAKATGATLLVAPSSVGGTDGAKDYFTLFDSLIDLLQNTGGKS